ncbi:hypothetical protein AQUCO_01100521v1 [Aquilegia coerulea]|uniref:Uncharacterized protein n=1 Tax=Aquilegia coerulea TaxID=218851 RepID=A0A2G5E7H4_AQUCA|nr:hypothetical protein AQUCO_01100521v1 [Aquilegia coerulea]
MNCRFYIVLGTVLLVLTTSIVLSFNPSHWQKFIEFALKMSKLLELLPLCHLHLCWEDIHEDHCRTHMLSNYKILIQTGLVPKLNGR